MKHAGKRFSRNESSFDFRRRPLRWIAVCAFASIVAIGAVTAIAIDGFKETTIKNNGQRLEDAVLLLARHFDRQLDDFAILQRDVVDELKSYGYDTPEIFSGAIGTLAVHETLRSKVGGWHDVAGLNVFDSQGRLINSSRQWPVADRRISDRDYFKAIAFDPNRESEVAIVPSRLARSNAIVFARRITGPNGIFLGVVTRAISPDVIESFFASAGLGEGAAVAMHHRSGAMLARFPVTDQLGRNFRNGGPDQLAVFERENFTARLTSPVDGQDRLLASRSLASEPIIIVATQTLESTLAVWRTQTKFLMGMAAAVVLIICTLLYLSFRQITKHLSLEKSWLQTAVDNMNQGLLLFDAFERLIVCNKRYLAMYGLSSQIIRPGCSLHQLLRHREQTGSLNTNADSYYQNLIKTKGSSHRSIVETTGKRLIEISSEPVASGGWLATHEDVTDRIRAEEKVNHLAYYDQLTNLPNRVLFREDVKRRLQCVGPNDCVTVIYVDIDKFKSVNDSLGHHVGDMLLVNIASCLAESVGPNDLVARLGGDEFAIVTDLPYGDDAEHFVATVQKAIRLPTDCLGHQVSVDSSIGVAIGPQHGSTLDELLKNADLAMYSAKAKGRRGFEIFTCALEERAERRQGIEADIRKGLREDGFQIHFQPVVSLATNRINGFEALLRFQPPGRPPLSPAEFIPIAEETGLINELGAWVLSSACLVAARWPDHIVLAVNVSPVQIRSGTFALHVINALALSGLSADRLEIEITEAVLISDDDEALALLHQLKDLGVRIALDDFGTGYSSLSYLRRFPFDKIKIDRNFVADLDKVGGSSAIIKAIVSMASAHNMTTTAEGVETEEQRDLVNELGCDLMQGYLFSPALPAEALYHLFEQETAAAGNPQISRADR